MIMNVAADEASSVLLSAAYKAIYPGEEWRSGRFVGLHDANDP
jgi:hypothetical protein